MSSGIHHERAEALDQKHNKMHAKYFWLLFQYVKKEVALQKNYEDPKKQPPQPPLQNSSAENDLKTGS